MEPQSHLIYIRELEEIILSHLKTPIDFFQLMLINKHFHKIVDNDIIFLEFKNFCEKENTMKIYSSHGPLYQKFMKTCKYGYPYTAKYLIEKYAEIKTENHISALRASCMNGHLKIAQWLYYLNPQIDVHCFDELAFRESCENGHFGIVKWLYSITNAKINIHAVNEYAFQFTCRGGHFEIAKWLYSIANGKINIHANEEFAFTSSCGHDHIEIAQWLYSLDNTVYTRLNYPRLQCLLNHCKESGFKEIIEWLTLLGIHHKSKN